MMEKILSFLRTPNVSDPVQEDWFFGQKTVPLLYRWRARFIKRPSLYLISYIVFWVAWVVAYSVTMQVHGVDGGVVHTAPHAAFSAIITGAILFPRLSWWLPMTIFTLLFAVSLFGPEMRYLIHSQDGVALGVLAFVLNLVIGLAAVRFLFPMAELFAEKYLSLNTDVVLLAVIFVLLPLAAALTYVLQWGFFLVAATSDDTLAGFSTEMLGQVLHRGVRGGIITIGIVFLFIRLPNKHEVVLWCLGLPFVAAAVWLSREVNLSAFEVVVATILLVHAVIMPFMATVMLILFVFWPLAAITSAFMLPLIDGFPHQAVAQTVSSVLAVLVIPVLLAKLQSELFNERRRKHSQNLLRLQCLVSSGRFALDARKGVVYLDDAAQVLLGLAEESNAQAFLQRFDEESVARFFEALTNVAPEGVALSMRGLAAPTSGERVEITLRVCLVADENANESREFFYGLIEDISAF